MEDKIITNPDNPQVNTNNTPVVVPENPTKDKDKVDNSDKLTRLEEKIMALEAMLNKKEVKPEVVLPNEKPADDFEAKMAAYEKKKFEASLTADDKAKLAKVPGSASMSIETMQYILGLTKTEVPLKQFPQVSGGASTTVEPQSQEDYIKQYKKYEESLKKGGK